MPPMATTKISRIGSAMIRDFAFSVPETAGLAGPRAGLRHTLYQMTSMKQSMQVMPGSTPAMNRSPMD